MKGVAKVMGVCLLAFIPLYASFNAGYKRGQKDHNWKAVSRTMELTNGAYTLTYYAKYHKSNPIEWPFRAGANLAAKLIWENPGVYTNSKQVQDAAWTFVQEKITPYEHTAP